MSFPRRINLPPIIIEVGLGLKHGVGMYEYILIFELASQLL